MKIFILAYILELYNCQMGVLLCAECVTLLVCTKVWKILQGVSVINYFQISDVVCVIFWYGSRQQKSRSLTECVGIIAEFFISNVVVDYHMALAIHMFRSCLRIKCGKEHKSFYFVVLPLDNTQPTATNSKGKYGKNVEVQITETNA